MNVDSIVTRKVFTVNMDDSVGTVRQLLEAVAFHHLLVMNRDKLVGILSDRDVLRAVSPFSGTEIAQFRDDALLNKRVHQIMTRNPVTVTLETPVVVATQVMLGEGFSCLPVVNGNGALEGLITFRDLLRHFVADELAAEATTEAAPRPKGDPIPA